MNLAQKHGLDFLRANAPDKTRVRIVQTEASLFLDIGDKAWTIASCFSFLLKELYLVDRQKDAFAEIPNLCSSVYEYLMGNWQKTLPLDGVVSASEWHKFVTWFDNIRSVLMWSSAISDWQSIKKNLAFIDETVSIADSGNEGRLYYCALRSLFEDNVEKCENILSKLQDVRNKKYRLQSQCVMAILHRDAATTTKAWNELFKLWINRDAKMDWFLAPELTFLYYLAKKYGCEIPLTEKQSDYIVRFL